MLPARTWIFLPSISRPLYTCHDFSGLFGRPLFLHLLSVVFVGVGPLPFFVSLLPFVFTVLDGSR